MQPTTKSNSTKDFCKTCTSQALPVLGHWWWGWWAAHRGLGVCFPWDGGEHLSVTGRKTCPQFCRASWSHPLPQNTLVGGFRHSQGLWKPPLGCAPTLSKHFKDTNELSCLSGSMSQSDKNWNKTPETKAEERGRKCCEAQRTEDVGTAGLNCLLPCCARQNVPGTALLTFGLLLVGVF